MQRVYRAAQPAPVQSSGTNNSTQTKFKQFVLSRGFNSGFSLELMVKDLSIALELARSNDAAVPFSALCREMWAVALGMKVGTDHTEMARLSAMIARVEL